MPPPAAAILALLLAAPPASVETPTAAAATLPPERRLTLRELFRLAEKTYPELAVVAAERDQATALDRLAYWTRWTPKLTDTTIFGVVPDAKGDIFFSPDSPRDLNGFGPFWRTRVDASLPLFTFGRVTSSQQAARAYVRSKDAKADAKTSRALDLASRAYFGALYAQDSLGVVGDVRKHLDDLLDNLQHPKEGEPEPEPVDILRARNYAFQLDRLGAAAERGIDVASAGLTELAGLPPGERVRPAAASLAPLATPVPDLAAGIAEALVKRPEIRELELAALAKEALARVAHADRLPALGLDGRFEYGRAPGRQQQDNPFVYEPFNVRSLGVSFGLRWDLNFLQTGAQERKVAAEAAEMRARGAALAAETRVQVAEAHARLVEAQKVEAASRRAMSNAASWLRMADENYGLGTAGVKDVVESYSAYILTKNGRLDAIQNLNLALVSWRLALGREPLEEGESP